MGVILFALRSEDPLPAAVPEISAAPAPTPAVDAPLEIGAMRDALLWFKDADGNVIAATRHSSKPTERGLFFGTTQRVFKQRIRGGGRSSATRWNFSFWDPRISSTRSSVFNARDDAFWLQCGESKRPLVPVPSTEVPDLMAGIEFFEPRWRRQPVFLGRFPDGSWIYVDSERTGYRQVAKDHKIYRGPAGSMVGLATVFARQDIEGAVYATTAGEIRQGPEGTFRGSEFTPGRAFEAVWVSKGVETKLRVFGLGESGRIIYDQLGVYPDRNLGTPCP